MPERKVYRFRIDPTAEQETAFTRFAGARRFVFNWALARRKETYEQTGRSISWSELSVELTDFAHKFSTSVVEGNDTIACETLNLKGMSKTKLAKSVHDAAHRETFRQIEYKARWRNRNFVFVGRWFPSSQLCSACGHRSRELLLSDRSWTCSNCGARHDRDHSEGVAHIASRRPEMMEVLRSNELYSLRLVTNKFVTAWIFGGVAHVVAATPRKE